MTTQNTSPLKEAFKESFLKQGRTEQQAEHMAEIAAYSDTPTEYQSESLKKLIADFDELNAGFKAAGTKAKGEKKPEEKEKKDTGKSGYTLLKESFETAYLQVGHTPEEAARLAESAAGGR